MYRKKRDTETKLRILCINTTDPSDTFQIINISKYEAKNKYEKTIRESARKLKYPCEMFYGNLETVGQTLLERACKNTLIILLSSDYNSDIPINVKRLGIMNDIIWIHLYHPWELSPNKDILFFGKIFSKKKEEKYRQMLSHFEQEKKNALKKSNISPIFHTIDQDIETALNHFFKYRYVPR